jgi:hypothetical protein
MSKELTENIFWGIGFGAAAAFIIWLIVAGVFNTSSTETLEVMLQDGSMTDVIVITSKPYNETEWDHIKKVIVIEARHSSDPLYLEGRVTSLLNDEGYSIIAVGVDKRVTKFTIE